MECSQYITRGSMDADDFRDYMLCFIFLRYISNDYGKSTEFLETEQALVEWYADNSQDIDLFEEEMRRISYYIIKPEYLWSHIVAAAKRDGIINPKTEVNDAKLLSNLTTAKAETQLTTIISSGGNSSNQSGAAAGGGELPTLLQKVFAILSMNRLHKILTAYFQKLTYPQISSAKPMPIVIKCSVKLSLR